MIYKDGKDLALEYLRKNKEERTTTEIKDATKCTGVSRHLNKLFLEGKVSKFREGGRMCRWRIKK